MAFQIKDFNSIVASCINWMKSAQSKVTDFTVGSVARTMMEAPAAEIDELYQQMFNGLTEAIPVSVYQSFDFEAISAQPASGIIRVTVTSSASDVLIQSGAKFTIEASGAAYLSTADVTIAAGGTYGDVPVAAVTPGSAGNIAPGQVFVPSPSPENFVSASNLTAFANGLDQESENDRKLRFNAYIQSLARGTGSALEYGLTSYAFLTDANGNISERVVYVSIYEPWIDDEEQPISLVKCYIHNGIGGTSNDLVLKAREIIYGYYDEDGNAVPGWKAAGVRVDTYAATELPVNVFGTLTALPGYELSALVTQANQVAAAYVTGLKIKAKFQVASLVDMIMSIPGVANFVPADIKPPAAPTLGSTAGGSLGAATYYVKTTYVTPTGETLPSAIASLAVSANNLLTVASPPAVTGTLGWNIYVGTSSGSLEKQNAAMIGIGTGYTEPVSGLVSGDAPPAASTARFIDMTSTYSQKFMPGTMGIT